MSKQSKAVNSTVPASAPAYGLPHVYEAIPPDASGTLGPNAVKGSAHRQRAVDRHLAAIATPGNRPEDKKARSKSGKDFLRKV